MTITLQTLNQALQSTDLPSVDELARITFMSAYVEKLYVVSNHDAPCCFFCNEIVPKLLRCACGCFVCQKCVYVELPSIPLARCPYCSLSLDHDKQLTQKTTTFGFGPFGQQTATAQMYSAHKPQTAELFPLSHFDDQHRLSRQRAICRFHEAISPYGAKCSFCCPLQDDTASQLREHISQCQNRAEQHFANKTTAVELLSSDNIQTFQIRQDLALYLENAPFPVTLTGTSLPMHRAPLVAHIMTRKPVLEQLDPPLALDQRPDYWNYQVIVFRNPVDPQDLSVYKTLTVSLRITHPDATQQSFRLWVSTDHLRTDKVLRYFGRIHARQPGAIRWDLVVSATLSPEISFFSTKTVTRFVQMTHLVDQKISMFQLARRLPNSRLKKKIDVCEKMVETSLKILEGEGQPENMTMEQFQSLKTLAISPDPVDATSLIVVLLAYSKNSSNKRIIIAENLLDIVVEAVDQFTELLIVQKAFVELIAEISKDFNGFTIKCPLAGRLRRAKAHFGELTDKAEEALQNLGKVSVQAWEREQ